MKQDKSQIFSPSIAESGGPRSADNDNPPVPNGKRHFIRSKWIRRCLKTLLCLIAFILIIPLLLYIPPIQNFLVKTAAEIASDKTGMKIGVEKFRLRFPLDVSLSDVSVIEASGDTMVLAKEVVADVKLLPLLHLDAQINELQLKDAYYRMLSTDSSMLMTISAGLLKVDDKSSMNIGNSTINLNEAYIKDGDIYLSMDVWKQKPTPADTTSTPFLIKANKLNFDNMQFTMSMLPTIDTLQFMANNLVLEKGIIDLRENKMSLGNIAASSGFAQMLTPSVEYVASHPAPETDTTSVASAPFIINAGKISLAGFGARYAVKGSPKVNGFDANDIRVDDLNLTLENFYNKAADISLPISSISGKLLMSELSDITLLPVSKGTFSMDSTGMMLKDFHLATPYSRIDATAAIPNALMQMLPDALLDVDIDANIGIADVNAFMPELKAFTSVIPKGTLLKAIVKADGELGDADIQKLDINLPGVLSFRANGKAKNALELNKMVAKVIFEGELQKPGIVKNFVQLPGIDIPMLKIKGNASANKENYAANFQLGTSRGDVVGNGKVGMNSEIYEANLNVNNLNVGSFIGDTVIGNVSATLYARGAGFNPEKRGAHTDIRLNVDNINYNHRDLKNIDVVATLQNGSFTIDANSFSQSLYFNIAGNGSIADDFYQADIVADIHKVDLLQLGLSESMNYGSAKFHLFGNASPRTWIYDVTFDAENIDWHLPDQDLLLRDGISARLMAGGDNVKCNIDALGTSVEFLSGVGLKSIVDAFTEVGELIPQSLEQRRIDVVAIESSLPPFSLTANVDGKGLVDEFLQSSGMEFGNLNLDLSKDSVLQANMVLNTLKTSSMTLDTITLDMKSRRKLIDYNVHLGNRPGTMDEFANVNVSGYLGENRLSAYLVQHNIKKKIGYRLGFTASLADSIVSLRFTPLKSTIAYLPWKFNMDNYVDFNINNMKLDANLEASSDESSILMRSEKDENGNDGLHLNLKNIKVQDFLQMALNAPPVKATVNSDINVRYNGKALWGKGSLNINDFTYEKKRVGDFAFTLAAGMGNKGRSGGKIGLLVNGAEAAMVQFVLAQDSVNAGGGMVAERLNLVLKKFPLSIANPFLQPSTMSLSGFLNGNMAMSGSFTRPKLNGSITGDSIGVYINMLGTTLKFGDQPIVVADNVLEFDDFNVTAYNNNPLSINGTVDASKFSDILIDITAKAKNMQLTGDKKNKADITGNLFVDLDVSARGPMSRMNIDANLNVLPATDVTYNMMMGAGSDMLSGQGSADDVVRFVNFADSTLVAKADSLKSSMSMRITAKVVISQGTQVAVNMTGDLVTGGGKVECNPSGTLNYFQNYMGDMKLNGTLYTGTGYANYSIPVIGKKMFEFDRNSHITWNGDILNPTLAINASDEIKTNIQVNGNSQLVNFIVDLNIGNTLSAPSINFDLSTNDDMSISNELQSMTAEQRQQQAMQLLLTGMYTGPSAKSVKSNFVTGNLYSFLTSRLNAFAAQTIKGVDINFGVNQYEIGNNGSNSTNTSYSYQVSKSLINNRFKIVVGGNYSTDASTDENFQQNLISDIAFEYILRQTNTMSLNARLFRHTGFESILEGEITETGVGLSLRRRLAYFTEITHFGLSKLWKKPKKSEIPLPQDSILPAPVNTSDNSDISDSSDNISESSNPIDKKAL